MKAHLLAEVKASARDQIPHLLHLFINLYILQKDVVAYRTYLNLSPGNSDPSMENSCPFHMNPPAPWNADLRIKNRFILYKNSLDLNCALCVDNTNIWRDNYLSTSQNSFWDNWSCYNHMSTTHRHCGSNTIDYLMPRSTTHFLTFSVSELLF